MNKFEEFYQSMVERAAFDGLRITSGYEALAKLAWDSAVMAAADVSDNCNRPEVSIIIIGQLRSDFDEA